MPDVEAEARALSRDLDRQSLTYAAGVIDHINSEKALSYIATGANTGFGLPHRKFPQVAELPPGTLVEVGRAEPEGRPWIGGCRKPRRCRAYVKRCPAPWNAMMAKTSPSSAPPGTTSLCLRRWPRNCFGAAIRRVLSGHQAHQQTR